MRACEALLDRGWGKAPQAHTGADGDGDIRVVIRHIVNGRDVPPPIIEASPAELVPIGTDRG